jgi:hypothetical protein
MTRSDDHQETVLNTDLAARLAQIKQEAMRRGIVVERDAVTEDALLAQAAAGMAERRADRDDLVGSVIWGAIATGNRPVPAEPDDVEPADARLLPGDSRSVDQAGRE